MIDIQKIMWLRGFKKRHIFKKGQKLAHVCAVRILTRDVLLILKFSVFLIKGFDKSQTQELKKVHMFFNNQ